MVLSKDTHNKATSSRAATLSREVILNKDTVEEATRNRATHNRAATRNKATHNKATNSNRVAAWGWAVRCLREERVLWAE